MSFFKSMGLWRGFTAEQSEAFAKEEAKTHRHLNPGELTKAGDIYGGKDMGFLFTVGSPDGVPAGHHCDAQICYRIRRKL